MIDEFEQECRLLYEMGLKDSPLRLEYEEKVRDLSILREQMETEGKTKEQIALTMHERRRELGRLYKRCSGNTFIMQLPENTVIRLVQRLKDLESIFPEWYIFRRRQLMIFL